MIRPTDISVFISPSSHHFTRDELFNRNSFWSNWNTPYFHLRDVFEAQGIEVHTGDFLVRGEKRNKYNVYFSLGMVDHYRQLAGRPDTILSGFLTLEAAAVQLSAFRELRRISRYFKRIYCYTTSDAVARFGCRGLRFHKLHIPQPYEGVFEHLWAKKDRKFLTMVSTNRLARTPWQELYTERLRALEYFSRFNEIDLYGRKWDRMPDIVGETWIPWTLTRIRRYLWTHLPFLRLHPYEAVIKKVYKGPVEDKYLALSDYTFAICYENFIMPGWVNEKIFDCFLAGTIPVYWGAPDITDYVPANCFIDKRRFPTYDDLRAFLKSLTARDIQAYKDNMRDYFSSDMYKPFRKEAFAEIFLRAVEEDLGVELRRPADAAVGQPSFAPQP